MRKYKSVKWGKKEERSCSKRWGRIKKTIIIKMTAKKQIKSLRKA